MDVEDQRKIVQTLIIGDLLDAIIKKTKSVEKEYNGNDIKRLLKESANVISILDSHFPSIRLLDPVIICLFETFDAMHVLRLLTFYVSFECKTNLYFSHKCLGRYLRIGYREAIQNYTAKVHSFLEFTKANGHVHSHVAANHLIQVLETFNCGLASIAPDGVIEVIFTFEIS